MDTRDCPILVVDDNEMNRDMLSRRLIRRGYSVHTAEGGRNALGLVSERSYALILLDIMMPDIDGIEVLKKVRQHFSASDLPIIMATAKDESSDIVEALKLGANDYVTKPLDFPVVLARVETQLSLKRATDSLAEANRLLQEQATIDGLTNLANRRRFYEVMEQEWRRHQRSQSSLAVALLDVDCFKNYNDSLGHLAGDDCLKAIAGAIKAPLHRAGDLAARYGGEEFALLLPGTDNAGAASVCETVRQSIRDLAIPHPSSVAGDVVTVSTGYTTVTPGPEITIREFLHEADLALYHAKEEGRDCVVNRNDTTSVLVQ